MNKNDQPICEVSNDWIDWEHWKYRAHFEPIGSIQFALNRNQREDMRFIPRDVAFLENEALVYVLVVKTPTATKVLKVGKTSTSMKKRVASYNCGKDEYRAKGTCSTTNWFVRTTLKNLFERQYQLEVFGYYVADVRSEVDFGVFKTVRGDPKNLEKTILENLKKSGRFPPLCTQR